MREQKRKRIDYQNFLYFFYTILALWILTAPPAGFCDSASSTEPVTIQSVSKKVMSIQPKVNAWIAAGGNPNEVIPLGQKMDELMKAGATPDQINAQADAILQVVSPISGASQSAVTSKSTKEPDTRKEGSSSAEAPPIQVRIQEKIRNMQARAEKWVASGGNPQEVMEYMKKIDAFAKEGKYEEVEKTVDALSRLVDVPPAENLNDIRARIEKKGAEVNVRGRQWAASGGNPQTVMSGMERFDSYIRQGRLKEAEQTLDEMLAELPSAQSAVPAQDSGDLCGSSPFIRRSGRYTITAPCRMKGDLTLGGTAVLTVENTDFTLDGSIYLEDQAVLKIVKSTFTIANHFVLEHSITAKGNAVMELKDLVLKTNAGTVSTSLASQYTGYGHSVLRTERVKIDTSTSWLLANLKDSAALVAVNSSGVPSETYPHDSSTLTIRNNSASGHGVWLEFVPGSRAVLENLPDARKVFTYHFGRSTPDKTNVKYQVDVENGGVGFSVQSHAASQITIKDNLGPITIGYFLENGDKPEELTGLKPGSKDGDGQQSLTLTHQGRTLELVKAKLNEYAWQVYVMRMKAPVTIKDSVINELGVPTDAEVRVQDSSFQFAVIAAMGHHSVIAIKYCTLDSQSILAQGDGSITLEDSLIRGSLIQARENSRVVLLNNRLEKNTLNPFNGPGPVRFVTDGSGQIVVLGLDPFSKPVKKGQRIDFVGDAFVRTAAENATGFTYTLSYRPVEQADFLPLVTQNADPKVGASLGRLETGLLAPGAFRVRLDFRGPDGSAFAVERAFDISG